MVKIKTFNNKNYLIYKLVCTGFLQILLAVKKVYKVKENYGFLSVDIETVILQC